jgi:hypothetical protein
VVLGLVDAVVALGEPEDEAVAGKGGIQGGDDGPDDAAEVHDAEALGGPAVALEDGAIGQRLVDDNAELVRMA